MRLVRPQWGAVFLNTCAHRSGRLLTVSFLHKLLLMLDQFRLHVKVTNGLASQISLCCILLQSVHVVQCGPPVNDAGRTMQRLTCAGAIESLVAIA